MLYFFFNVFGDKLGWYVDSWLSCFFIIKIIFLELIEILKNLYLLYCFMFLKCNVIIFIL